MVLVRRGVFICAGSIVLCGRCSEGAEKMQQRWKWAVDFAGHSLVLFEDGSAFEATFGRRAKAWSEEGHEWRPYRTLPKAFRAALSTDNGQWLNICARCEHEIVASVGCCQQQTWDGNELHDCCDKCEPAALNLAKGQPTELKG